MGTRLPKSVLGMVMTSAALWGTDHFLGTWKMKRESSKEANESSSPRIGTMTCIPVKGGAKCTQDGVDGQGRSVHVEYIYTYDGKEHAVKGSRGMDTVSLKRNEPHEQEFIAKKEGQVIGTFRMVVSKDGKTMTGTWNYKDTEGKPKSMTCIEVCHR